MTELSDEQKRLLQILEDRASVIEKASVNLKKCPKKRLSVGYVTTRLKIVEEYWQEFKETHFKLATRTPREERANIPYFINEDYDKIEEIYSCLHADLTDILESLQNKNSRSEHDSSFSQDPFSLAKLPKIQMPTFSGKYEDWPTFQDLFLALVHETNLSAVQKLHYLKTSVCGDAEILLRHIQITESNYQPAWELLKNRFGNKRMIMNSLLKRLFGQKRAINQSASQIKSLLDATSECISGLNNLKINTDGWDPLIIFLVSQKLDAELLKDWEEYVQRESEEDMPTWEDMKKFLESKFRTLELVAPISPQSKEKTAYHKSFHVTSEEGEEDEEKESEEVKSAHASVTSQPSCSYCKREHYIFNCKDFAKLSVDQRHDFVKNNYLCFNCLVPNHSVYRCKQRTSCRICKRKHHSLLHQVKETNQEQEAQQQPEQEVTSAHVTREQISHEVLLATAQVNIISSNGEIHTLRALIDQGSEASFVSARVVELLTLPRTKVNGVVSGVGEGTKIPINHLVDLYIKPRLNTSETIQVKAYVLKTISTQLPSKRVGVKLSALQTLDLADPTYNTPSKVDILLGADIYGQIIEFGLIKMPEGIVAQKTSLGWILSGQIDKNVQEKVNRQDLIALHITRVVAEDNDMLRRFWEIETELYKKKKIYTKEEKQCEDIYKNTTRRSESGRYIVQLPLRQSIEETVKLCGETKQQALNRFKGLEKKFERNPKLKVEYTKVVEEYIKMGHMKKSDTRKDALSVYLPHHAVIREDKDTTKIRVVFDASAKGSHGHSLNDTMMVGPVIQPDLRSLILKWRTHKICVVGDIVKMYRMIIMTDEHTNLQRIVWRSNPGEDIESYDLTTVTFGTAGAPFLAVRTLSQLADDEAQEYPNISSVIKNSFYMDDLMMGSENTEQALKMCKEIKTVLKKGGFEMQKWSSNSEVVLEGLKEEGNTKDTIEIKLDNFIKILGLTWDRKNDDFEITVQLPEITFPITKRSILSDVARLFDPFGWLAPVVVIAKSFIQKLWLCSLGWDDELPINLSTEWQTYREELKYLQNIKIQRWMNTTHDHHDDVQLHGFADASSQAYAAVAYLKVVKNDTIHITMIASRTKVAPLKQISIPKLELCAAALLTELIRDLVEILHIPKDKVFAWSDSTVVLSWLQSHPSRWQTFVANRVADITRVIGNDRWRHVRSMDNPADIATRGIKASDLVHFKTWWTGPEWLKQNTNFESKEIIPTTDLEMKRTFQTSLVETPIWERFSTILRMKRVLAYCRRFLKRVKTGMYNSYLSHKEMEEILEQCIRYYQNVTYGKEIEEIKREGRVKRKSTLITLSPFLDEKGLIRVGGRLKNASIVETAKHPIIIPSGQHITKLLINEAHGKTFHGGIQLMMAYIRSKYWVIGLKAAVKYCIRNCKTCIVDKAKVSYQFMGQLPAARINQHRAFLNTGVDYAGPINIRTSKGRGHHATKGYICLFVCMSTRAIHLEVVTDLTSQAFIAAFRRFVARRGQCLNLWSDNGTNFIGAAKELKDLFQKAKSTTLKEIAAVLANDGTTWHFIPPRMPNCGGLWEAGIQSIKRHLTRINKDTKLTYEEMSTLLSQIEACVNSRPMCQIDNTTETALTPGHFLIGEPLIGVPDTNYEDKKIGLLTRWQLVQRMTQDFWRRWHSEYLHTLQQRYKWQEAVPAPSVGDIVIIKEENIPPTKWLLGRIKHLHPGTDNLVRVVTVQYKGNHEMKRPLSKLIPLPKTSD